MTEPSSSSRRRSAFRLVQLLLLTSSTAAVTTAAPSCSTGFDLSFVEDFSEQECSSMSEFQSSLDSLVQGFQSYLEVQSYNPHRDIRDLSLKDLTTDNPRTMSPSSSSYRLEASFPGEGSYQAVSAQAPDLQVLECLHSDYCAQVTTQHCSKQTQRRRSQRRESACQWIARQDLPGCLAGAALLCQEMDSSSFL